MKLVIAAALLALVAIMPSCKTEAPVETPASVQDTTMTTTVDSAVADTCK